MSARRQSPKRQEFHVPESHVGALLAWTSTLDNALRARLFSELRARYDMKTGERFEQMGLYE